LRTGIIAPLALLIFAAAQSQAAETLAANPTAGREAPAAVPLSASDLSGVTGGETIHAAITTQNLNATVTGNALTAGVVQSGAVNFGNSALNGFDGIGNFVINTGNNNVLQGSLSVTVMTTAPGG